MAATNRVRPAVSRFVHSFLLKLSILAIVLLTVPVVLYWQFGRYERQQRTVLYRAAEETSRLIAAMLRPHLVNFRSENPAALREALAAAAVGDVQIKLLMRPAASKDHGGNFFYIMSSSPVSSGYLQKEQRELINSGVLEKLTPTCDRYSDLDVRFINPAGRSEILTSMTPVHAGDNCWVVITSKSAASLSRGASMSFLQPTMTIRAMTLVYVLSTMLILWLLLHLWRNVRRFRRAARYLRLRRGGGVSFRDLNTIPELRGVAEDFDSLVSALIESQTFIRRAAEENAHALKAPLAVIAQSLEPLKRTLTDQDVAAQRSLYLIERSVSRLDTLVSSVRDLDEAAADVIYPECRLINLSDLLARLLKAYEITPAAQKIHLATFIDSDVNAYASEDIMESIVENLLENAVSFTGEGGVIEVRLCRHGDLAQITVADRGPGVDPQNIAHIFERYVSYRPAPLRSDTSQTSSSHQGIGLWIVRRNVKGLGGTIEARNRAGGGFEVSVSLRTKL
jgi:two-component system sensor histidine kinase ChvG